MAPRLTSTPSRTSTAASPTTSTTRIVSRPLATTRGTTPPATARAARSARFRRHSTVTLTTARTPKTPTRPTATTPASAMPATTASTSPMGGGGLQFWAWKLRSSVRPVSAIAPRRALPRHPPNVGRPRWRRRPSRLGIGCVVAVGTFRGAAPGRRRSGRHPLQDEHDEAACRDHVTLAEVEEATDCRRRNESWPRALLGSRS